MGSLKGHKMKRTIPRAPSHPTFRKKTSNLKLPDSLLLHFHTTLAREVRLRGYMCRSRHSSFNTLGVSRLLCVVAMCEIWDTTGYSNGAGGAQGQRGGTGFAKPPLPPPLLSHSILKCHQLHLPSTGLKLGL